VAVEARGEGVLADGTVYAPSYAQFFEVRDGLITSMREYIDTEYVGATFRLPLKKGG
jgi:ketosteroid isomerase-like protein